MVNVQDTKKNFFRILLTYHFIRFPYLLTNFSRDVRLSWPQQIFFRILLTYHFIRFPYLITTFSRDVRLSWPQKIFFRILLIYHSTGFSYLLTTFPKNVTPSRPKNFFFGSRSITTLPDFLTYLLLFEGCQAELTSKLFFHISLSTLNLSSNCFHGAVF